MKAALRPAPSPQQLSSPHGGVGIGLPRSPAALRRRRAGPPARAFTQLHLEIPSFVGARRYSSVYRRVLDRASARRVQQEDYDSAFRASRRPTEVWRDKPDSPPGDRRAIRPVPKCQASRLPPHPTGKARAGIGIGALGASGWPRRSWTRSPRTPSATALWPVWMAVEAAIWQVRSPYRQVSPKLKSTL